MRGRAPDSEGEVHEEEADKRLECVFMWSRCCDDKTEGHDEY
jgi:hypothetical protein